jgi:AraC family transcriptional regulator
VRGLPKRRLHRALDYIREHIGHDLSLGDIARVTGLGVSHFKLQFRESMGMPVHQYVIAARVEKALDLLLHSNVPITEVALRSGFSSQSHLSRHLRRLRGITPAALRREAR